MNRPALRGRFKLNSIFLSKPSFKWAHLVNSGSPTLKGGIILDAHISSGDFGDSLRILLTTELLLVFL